MHSQRPVDSAQLSRQCCSAQQRVAPQSCSAGRSRAQSKRSCERRCSFQRARPCYPHQTQRAVTDHVTVGPRRLCSGSNDSGPFNRSLGGLYLSLSNRWLRWLDSARSLAARQLWHSFTKGCGSCLLKQAVVSRVKHVRMKHRFIHVSIFACHGV